MTPSMTASRVGDVVAVEFPFTDMQGRKRRPGVVLAGDASDLLLARITTHEPRDSFDVQLDDWTIAGLPKPSTVRLLKLASLATFRGCSLEARCISWSMDSEASSIVVFEENGHVVVPVTAYEISEP